MHGKRQEEHNVCIEKGQMQRDVISGARLIRRNTLCCMYVKVIKADVSNYAEILKAMTGIDVAFYLIHSMDGSSKD